jgi:hypothetical protein
MSQTSIRRLLKDLHLAVEESNSWYSSRDVAGDEWGSVLFRFVQHCRFHPVLFPLEAITAADFVAFVFEKADPSWEWDRLSDNYSQASWESFVCLWDKVRVPPDFADPLAEAFRRACEWPSDDVPIPLQKGRENYRLLYVIALRLSEIVGADKAIALPVERLAELLGISRQRVGHLRDIAVTAGWLELAQKYQAPRKGGSGRAALYWFRPRPKKVFR